MIINFNLFSFYLEIHYNIYIFVLLKLIKIVEKLPLQLKEHFENKHLKYLAYLLLSHYKNLKHLCVSLILYYYWV